MYQRIMLGGAKLNAPS